MTKYPVGIADQLGGGAIAERQPLNDWSFIIFPGKKGEPFNTTRFYSGRDVLREYVNFQNSFSNSTTEEMYLAALNNGSDHEIGVTLFVHHGFINLRDVDQDDTIITYSDEETGAVLGPMEVIFAFNDQENDITAQKQYQQFKQLLQTEPALVVPFLTKCCPGLFTTDKETRELKALIHPPTKLVIKEWGVSGG